MRKNSEGLKSAVWLSTIGLVIIASTVGFMFVGLYLDKILGTKAFGIAMMFLGLIGGLWKAYRMLIKEGSRR